MVEELFIFGSDEETVSDEYPASRSEKCSKASE
jgi:hypothetical protein